MKLNNEMLEKRRVNAKKLEKAENELETVKIFLEGNIKTLDEILEDETCLFGFENCFIRGTKNNLEEVLDTVKNELTDLKWKGE